MKNKDFIVCGYAVGKKYHNFADRLESGLKKLDMEYDIEKYKLAYPLDTFRNIQLYKPTFVKEKLIKHKKAVMYVDIDMIFLSKPNIPRIDFDVGVVLRTGENGNGMRGALRCGNFLTLGNGTGKSYNVLNYGRDLCNPDTGLGKRRPERRDHARLNATRKIIDHKEFVLNSFIKNDVIGYTERGGKRRLISELGLPVSLKRKKKIIRKEKKLYGKIGS